jgi:hypothetical protein
MSLPIMSWVDTADGLASIAQALAILVGGLWAYFKFFRGRTFARRAEVTLATSGASSSAEEVIRVDITLRNTGASKIELDQDLCVLYLYAATAADVRPGINVNWGEHIVITQILADHGWIEAQEVVREEVLIPLRVDDAENAPPVAYKIVCKVIAKRVFWRKNVQWTANAVVEVGDKEGTTSGAEEPQS